MQISAESLGAQRRALFFSFTRVRSQPMASELSCVTLLPRPDRTGKLIAKVKRNKGATPSESLDESARRRKRERARSRRAGREREDGGEKETGRRRCRQRERERHRQKKRDVRSYRSEPRGLEIGFLAQHPAETCEEIRSIREFSLSIQ